MVAHPFVGARRGGGNSFRVGDGVRICAPIKTFEVSRIVQLGGQRAGGRFMAAGGGVDPAAQAAGIAEIGRAKLLFRPLQ